MEKHYNASASIGGEKMQKLTVKDEGDTRKLICHELAKTEEGRYGSRLLAILLACSGMSSYGIAGLLDHSPKSVQLWIEHYNSHGLEGLREKKKAGRPRLISGERFTRLLEDISRKPSAFGYTDDDWNCNILSDRLRTAYGITLSERHCRRIMQMLKERIPVQDNSE